MRNRITTIAGVLLVLTLAAPAHAKDRVSDAPYDIATSGTECKDVTGSATCTVLDASADARTGRLTGSAAAEAPLTGGAADALTWGHIHDHIRIPPRTRSIEVVVDVLINEAHSSAELDGWGATTLFVRAYDCPTCALIEVDSFITSTDTRADEVHPGGQEILAFILTAAEGETLGRTLHLSVFTTANAEVGYLASASGSGASMIDAELRSITVRAIG